jgi:hypothetical protein
MGAQVSGRVRIYWNFHEKCYSVLKAGRVVLHATELSVRNPVFSVRPGGKGRVRSEKRKNVHAFVVGELCESSPECDVGVTYDPYKYDTFVERSDSSPIFGAGWASLGVVDSRANIRVRK